jgi:hypothetical protein
MTTYYRNDENQVFSFQADIDYEAQEISGYEIMLETGEEVYKGTIQISDASPDDFEKHIQQFVAHMKQELEPFRVLMS